VEIPEGEAAAHAARWLGEMDRHGVGRMVTFASVPEEAASVAQGAAASAGRLIPFSVIDPSALGAASRVHRLVESHGMRGLVLFPALHRYDLSQPACAPFLRAVETLRLPLVVHLGVLRIPVRELLGLPAAFDESLAVPARLRGAVERHPGIRFVVPHFGGRHFRELLGLASALPNVFLDTSGSNAWRSEGPEPLPLADVFRRAIDAVGADRILFGTDSSVFPRGWRRDVFEEQRNAMREAGIPAADEALILGGNARCWFEAPAR
jgi:predicted TIM-barrel fold metal-dependent hydrolase